MVTYGQAEKVAYRLSNIVGDSAPNWYLGTAVVKHSDGYFGVEIRVLETHVSEFIDHYGTIPERIDGVRVTVEERKTARALTKIAEKANPLLERLHKLQREKAVILKELRALQELCDHEEKRGGKRCTNCGKKFDLPVDGEKNPT